ncbi:hypothetical protein MHU86_6029 [Fragilaria crotonensis]|nr:hypothetical protein MHU86_6029 [Fragilaria crotonensis]
MYCLRVTSRFAATAVRPCLRIKATTCTTTTTRRVLSNDAKNEAAPNVGLWNDAKFWGGMGALAGWGMSGAAIYDATLQGPEVISLNMTGVLLVYSSLFARWAFIVKPQNLLLAGCHIANIAAQSNQMRRGLNHKIETGQEDQVKAMLSRRRRRTHWWRSRPLGTLHPQGARRCQPRNHFCRAADAGPFTVHFGPHVQMDDFRCQFFGT